MRALQQLVLLFLSVLPLAISGAWAQPYPTRAIRLIVPVTPGGGVDFIARLVGAGLSERLGQPVIIDNRPGAGNVLGSALAAKSSPDGHTLLLANNSSHGVAQARTTRLPYDTINDFTPIAVIAAAQFLLATRPSFPANSVQELVGLAKAKPGELNYGAAGSGTQTYLMGELFKLVTGTRIANIAYQSAGPATTALFSGEVQLSFLTTAGSLPLIQAGRLKPLAITGLKRSQLLPDVRTFIEQGVTGFETGAWYALVGPAGIPRAIVRRLNEEVIMMVRDAGLQEKLTRQGSEPVGSTSEECAETIRNELKKWTSLVQQTGIRFE